MGKMIKHKVGNKYVIESVDKTYGAYELYAVITEERNGTPARAICCFANKIPSKESIFNSFCNVLNPDAKIIYLNNSEVSESVLWKPAEKPATLEPAIFTTDGLVRKVIEKQPTNPKKDSVEFIELKEKRTVIAIVRNEDGGYSKGIAKCLPEDKYDKFYGMCLALGRALYGTKADELLLDLSMVSDEQLLAELKRRISK